MPLSVHSFSWTSQCSCSLSNLYREAFASLDLIDDVSISAVGLLPLRMKLLLFHSLSLLLQGILEVGRTCSLRDLNLLISSYLESRSSLLGLGSPHACFCGLSHALLELIAVERQVHAGALGLRCWCCFYCWYWDCCCFCNFLHGSPSVGTMPIPGY